MYALFFYFRKVFDNVPRGHPQKLHDQFKIKGKLLQLIRALLSTNKIRIDDGLRISDEMHKNKDIIQGDSLSPLLFTLFVVDLAATFRSVGAFIKSIFYGDDIVVFSSNREHIQDALNTLGRWTSENSMTQLRQRSWSSGDVGSSPNLINFIQRETIEMAPPTRQTPTYSHYQRTHQVEKATSQRYPWKHKEPAPNLSHQRWFDL